MTESSENARDRSSEPDTDPDSAAKPTVPAEGVTAPPAGSSHVKSTGIVSIAIMCSRVLGLVREIVFSALFGANRWTDMFRVAFRTPNMLRDLFAEGALSTAFVTTFTKTIKTEGDESAWTLAHRMLTLTLVFMSVLTVLGILLAPWILEIMVPGWGTYSIRYTVLLARFMYPFIALVSLSALVMGMLNARGKFFIPALASSFFNIGSIVGGTALAYWMDPTFGPVALVGFAGGTLIGGLCQLFVQFPVLLRTGFRFRLNFQWRDSKVRKVLQLMWPALISGSAVQLSVFINTIFASFLTSQAPLTWLDNAFRLMQLPLGVFGVAVGMVTLPAASRAVTGGIDAHFGTILSRGLRIVFLLTLPSAIGLAILAEPIMSLIYERGKFTAFDAAMAAAALRTYAVGLVFYSGIKVVQPTFYAIDRRFFPMTVTLIAITVSAALNAVFIFWLGLGHEFLALATSIGAAVNFTILFFTMRRLAGHLEGEKILRTLARLAPALVLLAAVCFGAQRWVLDGWAGYSFWLRAVSLLGTIAAGGIVYFGVALALGVEEATEFGRLLRRRIRR